MVGSREAAREEGCTARWLRHIILGPEMFVRCTLNHLKVSYHQDFEVGTQSHFEQNLMNLLDNEQS